MKAQLISIILAIGYQVQAIVAAQVPGPAPSSVPPAVQNTINVQVGANQVTSITPETTNGMAAYRVSFPRNGTPIQLLIAQDGSILSTISLGSGTPPTIGKATTVAFSSLPQPVQTPLPNEP